MSQEMTNATPQEQPIIPPVDKELIKKELTPERHL
jgi:hypothetical protein